MSNSEETTIQDAVDAAVAEGLLGQDLRESVIDLCRKGFADLRSKGEDTTGFVVDISRVGYGIDIRVRPPGDGPLNPPLVEGYRTTEQLVGTYRPEERCPPGECICQFKNQKFPLLVQCVSPACPVPLQEMGTFEDMPGWALAHRASGCRSQSVVAIPKAEAMRVVADKRKETNDD